MLSGSPCGDRAAVQRMLDSPRTSPHTQHMTLADKITTLRLILAPLFFIIYFLPGLPVPWFENAAPWTVPALWALFIIAELTDMFDGMAARKRKEVGDFGKLYDPFADTLTQITLFLCFVIDGIFPAALFLVILYREFGVQFVRNLMLRKGVAMGARMGGKIKTVFYILAAAAALLAVSFRRLGGEEPAYTAIKTAALIIFCVSALISVISFADYLFVYKKNNKK
ncbi:MAG: CDP-diacylglycerol--glycerol-3-phosphate 3-phosphatidyltransferase [Treponema sp.]|nr:CDP-diacylglycerol--glycerol-3-phosphate 3-phosphatidyltransferase [Treponema sp.]